ncbi:MAG: TonB-dependent receptor [Acidobacteria bacterium]|nr:MAG: TonB-dependent receptor [Acidobacteriota bacterium]
MKSVLGIIICAFVLWAPTWAQTVSVSQISGTVKDPSGAILPGVEIKVVQTDTGVNRATVTDETGSYTLPNLAVGPYRFEASLPGFSTYVQTGIVLRVNSNPVINVVLQIGQVSQTLEVQADVAMVETHSTGVGQVIDQQRVVELPLNGRVATELIFLSGAATAAPAGDLNTNKNYPTVTISVAGGLATGMTYLMDGGTHNDPFNNLNLPMPFPDALQEFKAETSALPARYGHHAASAVNIVTKSGTNKFHGDLFEFVRNYKFNARNFFATERDSLKRNQFGGTLGGPIKTNKLFFFGGYQGKIEKSNPGTTISYAPTAAMRAGDFTGFASPACNGGRQITLAAPFVNNQLTPSNISPQALNFLKYVPTPADPCGRLQYGILANNNEHQAIGKMDYSFTEKHSLFGRYFFADYASPNPFDGVNVLEMSRVGQFNRAHSFVLGDTYLLSADTILSTHATVNRTRNNRVVDPYFSPADLGIQVYSLLKGFTGVSVTGNGFAIGAGATNPGYFNSTNYQLAEDVDLIRGAHQLALGVNFIHNNINTSNNRPTNGQFTFNGQVTGLPLADFMAGILSGGFVQGNPIFDNQRQNYIGLYLQDSWKLTRRLTLNSGVRWEPYLPMQHPFGWVSHFDQPAFVAGIRSAVYKNAPVGLTFPGDADYPGKSTTFAHKAQVAPRVGLVFDPNGDGKMTVRASYGIFYDAPHLFFNTRFANNPPWGAQITLSNPAGGLANPYQTYAGGNPFPGLAKISADSFFPLAGVYVNAPLDIKPTYLQQWNLSVQRQVGEWLFSASYLGNKSTHLWTGREVNPAVYSATATLSNTNQRRVLYLVNPAEGQYYGTIGQIDDGGTSSYNGMLLAAQRRLANNFSLLANYTLSHCISDPATTEITGPTYVNPNNRRADRANCDSDRRHLVNVSFVASTPQFANGALRLIASNWQLSGIVRQQSGNYSTVTTGADNALTGIGNQRGVQLLANPYDPNRTVDHYLNRAAFASPAPGTYSPLGAFTILNPSSLQIDTGLSRTFRVLEGQNIQFRWEVFNVPNRLNANAPVTALNNANFGKILSAQDPRIMQFALKYVF